MSQPTPYTIQTNFNQDEVNGSGGRSTIKTASLDTEFDNLKTTLDEILANLALLQRDDGKIKDGLGEPHLFNLSTSATGFLKYGSGTWSFIPDPSDLAQTAQAAAQSIASPENVQSGSLWYATSSGSGTAYNLTLNPAPSSIPAGLFIHMKAHTANTGPATLNVNSLGAQPIKRKDGSDLKANDIETNVTLILFYDGTNFQLFNSEANSQTAIELNASNIFRAFEEIQENHGGALLMEAGWSDSFSNANEQGADEANSTGYQHDPTNTLYRGTDPGIGLNHDQDFTTASDYSAYSETLTDVSVLGDTVTINNSDDYGSNVLYATITIGGNSASIVTRTDNKNITVESGHSLTGTNVTATIAYHKFESGVVKLSGGLGPETLDLTNTESEGTNGFGRSTSFHYVGNTFTTTVSGFITKIRVKLAKTGSPTGNITCQIFATDGAETFPTGSALATADNTLEVSSVTTNTSGNWEEFTFSSPLAATAGVIYCWTLTPSSFDDENYCFVRIKTNTDIANNKTVFSSDYGVTWFNYTRRSVMEVYITPSNNVINEYIPILPNYSNLLDIAPVSDVNSLTVIETLNSANIYYAFFKNAQSAWGANTELVIWDGTSLERSIARNNAGAWEYNSNVTFAATTWTTSSANNIQQAVRDAMAIAVNQMTGTTLTGVTDVALTVPTGKTGIVSILYSTVNANNPEVDQTRINFDSIRGAMDLKSKTYDPGFVPNEAYIWSRAEHSDADGSGTFSISRNGGIEWTNVSMAQQGGPLTGDIRILRGTVDISGQTSGQDLICRYQTTQNKDQLLHSWGLQAK